MKTITESTNSLRDVYEDNNYHTEALMVECIEEGRFDLIIELSKIAQVHEKRGHILESEEKLREMIADCLLDGTPLA